MDSKNSWGNYGIYSSTGKWCTDIESSFLFSKTLKAPHTLAKKNFDSVTKLNTTSCINKTNFYHSHKVGDHHTLNSNNKGLETVFNRCSCIECLKKDPYIGEEYDSYFFGIGDTRKKEEQRKKRLVEQWEEDQRQLEIKHAEQKRQEQLIKEEEPMNDCQWQKDKFCQNQIVSPYIIPRVISFGNSAGAKAIEKIVRISQPHKIADSTVLTFLKIERETKTCIYEENENKSDYPLVRLKSGGNVPTDDTAPFISSMKEEEILNTPMYPSTKRGKEIASIVHRLTYPNNRHNTRCFIQPKGRPVPRNMGWLWNTEEQIGRIKPNKCYRPGAVPHAVAKIINKHKEASGQEVVTKKKGKLKKTKVDEEVRPMLEVHKKEGCYLIVFNPIKNPFEEEGPKNKETSAIHILITKDQKALKINDDGSCECLCECADTSTEDSCDECCSDDESSSSSDDSEFDFEFTPPICLVEPDQVKKKTDIKTQGTQILATDFPAAKGKGKGKK